MADWQERIVLDPQTLAGKPTIKGTRLAVEFIVERLAQGWTEQELTDSLGAMVLRRCRTMVVKSGRSRPRPTLGVGIWRLPSDGPL